MLMIAGAQAIACSVAQESEAKGLKHVLLPAERIVADPDLSLAEMVHLISLGN